MAGREVVEAVGWRGRRMNRGGTANLHDSGGGGQRRRRPVNLQDNA